MPLHQRVENNIQINGVDLDENQKQIIKDAFLAAGVDKKVTFSKGHTMMFTTSDGVDLEGKNFVIKSGAHDVEWLSDSNSDIQIHTKIIHIEEETED